MAKNKNSLIVRNTAGNSNRFFDATWAVRDQAYIDGENDLPEYFQAVCLSNATTEEAPATDTTSLNLAKICVKPVATKPIVATNGEVFYRDEATPVPGDTLPRLEEVEDTEGLHNLLRFYHTLDYMIATAEDGSAITSPIRFGQIVNCKFLYGSPNQGTSRTLVFEIPQGEPIMHPNYVGLLSKTRKDSAKEPFSSSPATLLGSNPESPSSTEQQESNVDIPGGNSNITRKDDVYPIENMKAIIKELKAVGFDNQFVHMGVLAVCAKESRIKPKIETRYDKTNLNSIKEVFKKNKIHVDDAPFGIRKNQRFKDLTDKQITDLRDESPQSFFNVLYGGRFGNGGYKSGDGDKYRGRGFNQLTWKSNYSKMSGLIGIDILSYPEKMLEVPTAAKALAYFMKDFHTDVWTQQQLNSADSAESAAKMAADKTGGAREKKRGRKKALERLPQIKEMFARGDFDE